MEDAPSHDQGSGDLLDQIFDDDGQDVQRPSLEEPDTSHLRERDNWTMKGGAMNHEASEACKAFGKDVMASARELAKSLQKPTNTVLMEAGLLIQSARAQSLSNLYRSWYSITQPKLAEGIVVVPYLCHY